MSEQARQEAMKLNNGDAGLQDFLRHVYNTMCLGLVITGSVSFLVSHIYAVSHFLFSFPMFFVTALAPLAFAFFGFTPDRIATMPAEKVSFIFAMYSAVIGLSISCILWFIAPDVVARMFFVTAAAFAATSFYGLRLKKNIGGMESAHVMGAGGAALALLANLLLRGTISYYIVSFLGVFAFTGIAGWETHILKESYVISRGTSGAKDRMAIAGALTFYLSFVALFQYLLNFGYMQQGNRRR